MSDVEELVHIEPEDHAVGSVVLFEREATDGEHELARTDDGVRLIATIDQGVVSKWAVLDADGETCPIALTSPYEGLWQTHVANSEAYVCAALSDGSCICWRIVT